MNLKYILTLLLLAMGLQALFGQVFDMNLSSSESGTQSHQARNSISLLAGYNYTPGGSGMEAMIVNPVVNGSTSYTYTPIDPTTRSLNTSYLVGTTQGSFDVNSAGGASYSIPIDVLPGVNGLAPSLSLVYSSNSGPGVAGYGWQIGGISVVSRTGQNYYNDGSARGVELDYNDRYAIDGQRLVLASTSSSWGADLTSYYTDNDIFTRVQSQSASGNGPLKFTAQTKSGLKNFYGYTDDGSQKIDGYSEIINWFVTQTQDLYGNTINYSYLKNNNTVYPGEITYGSNKITFYYKSRTDVTTTYLKGKKIIQQLLLDKVTVSYNSNVVKTYQLNYSMISDNYNTYSALYEVVESGTGGSQLNSTVFSYQTPANVAMSQTTYNTTHSYVTYKSRMCAGDFNGDGKTDFFCLPTSNASWTGMRICYGNGDDSFSSGVSLSYTIDLSKLDDIQALDINGDGKDDILYELVNSGTSSFYFMLSDGSTLGSPVLFASMTNNTDTGMNGKSRRKNKKQENDNQLSGADYNGDGINEVFLNDPNGYWRVYSMANSSGTLTSYMNLLGSGTISTLTSQTLSGDFNGDGKAEIWSFEDAGLKIYSFSGSSLTQIYTSTWPTKNHFFTLGDFNADGKVDIFLYGYKNGGTEYDWSDWQVQLSTGTGFDQLNILQKKANLKNDYVRLGDFNGDGCTDLMVTSLNQSWTGTYFYITKNKGTDFVTHTLAGYPVASHSYFVADYNGDGRTDFICTDGESPWWDGYQLYKSTGNTAPLLEKIANGLNHLTTIAYTKLSQASASVYQLGSTTPAFPVFNFQGAMPVVSSSTIENGIGSSNTINYYYEGAKIHRQGKGFLCFSKTSATDVTAGLMNETLSDFSATYFYPQVTTVNKKTNSSVSIESTTNSWTQTVLDSSTKRIFPYISSSTQTNSLTGHSITLSSTFDSYGNPTQTVKTYNNGVSETTVANYSNTISSTDWKLGRLDNSTITYAKSGATSVSHTVRFTYYTDGIMKPDFIYYNEGTSLEYYKNHDYNSQGNLTQVYTYGASIGASQVNYTYDTDFVRTKTKTDELGHTTTFNYNSYGQLYTEVDYLGNTNTYAYDALGRQTSVSSTNGSQTTTGYVWTGTNKPTLGYYGVTQTGNDGSVATTWYDKLQRNIRTEKKGFGGSMIWIDTEYNSKGQIYRISDPYFANGTLVWAETNTYDGYGRTTNISRNSGRNTVYTYNSNTISETTGGKTFSKTYGPDGTLTSAADNGGTISYTYYPDGKTKSITTPESVVTTMQYADAARNQTQLADPSAGTINYTYDALGRVKTQIDPPSKQTTYTYLSDGRLSSVVNPEGTTSYSYNTNKQLTGISNSTTNVSRTYGYDTKGRVNSIGETIAGTTFSTSFTYDTYGRLSTRTHPSGIVETLGYNSNGYMSSISAGGSTRYTITSQNPREQLTGATYGSSLTASFGFDTYGYPLSTSAGTIQDYRYSFDPVTSNLNSRQNYKRSLSESFSYTDGLDRLNGVTGTQSMTVTYAANGNILTKSDISNTTQFSYGTNAGPYALTGITSSTNAIPTTSQNITYTSFEKVNTINEGTYTATFAYNSDNQRAKMDVIQSGTTILTRWYVGSRYMKETASGVTKEYTYLGGDAYNAPVVAITQSGTTNYFYLLRDYLGNITHEVNTSNAVVAEYNFDAWGRRRSADDWSYTMDSNDLALVADRGFTGHETLTWFNLVNMNGRLYDPLVGRFLNVDPYLQMPDFSQNFNRYSYCLNNPLRFNDPSGEIFGLDDLAAAFIGGAINWVSNGCKFNKTGLAYFGVGAAAGIATYYGGPMAGAAVMGAGNNLTQQVSQNGWNKVDWWNVAGASAMSMATSYLGGQIGDKFSPVFSKLASNVSSNPILQGAISQGLTNSAAGFSISTGMALANGESLNTALEEGGKGAWMGLQVGVINGSVEGYKQTQANSKSSPNTRNGHLAGDTHPETGVPFDSDGFPNFKNNLYNGGQNDVMIEPTGNRATDFSAANKNAGYKTTPKGYTWHHHQTIGRMQLVESTIHLKTGHTGGFSIWKY
jgi:RHS repeat-associated protein